MNVYIQETAASEHPPIKAHSLTEDDMNNNSNGKVPSPVEVAAPYIIGGKRRSYAPPFHPRSHASRSTLPKLAPLQMSGIQSKLMAETMQDLRERATKRQKTNDTTYEPEGMSLPSPRDGDDVDSSCNESRFDILDALDARPDIIHVVATSGGLITHWNEAFCKITKPSASLQKMPLTIFELVESKSLQSLYSMLALSLHNIGIVEAESFTLNEDDDVDGQDGETSLGLDEVEGGDDKNDKNSRKSTSSHLSLTLPCKAFRNSSTSYNITVVFMDDVASTKRHFLGILTPRTPCFQLPCGKILTVEDNLLCKILLGSNMSLE